MKHEFHLGVVVIVVVAGADGGPVGHAGGRGVARAARRHLGGRGEGGLVRMLMRLLLQGQPHRAVSARGRGGGVERRQTQRLLILVDLVTCNNYIWNTSICFYS